MLPNLYIIGIPKSGTTALQRNISQHPEIFSPLIKEPHIYDNELYYDDKRKRFNSQRDYLDTYKDDYKDEKFIVTAELMAYQDIEIINKIKTDNPNAVLIIMIRDPIELVCSMFKQRLKFSDAGLREITDNVNTAWQLSKHREFGNEFPKGCNNRKLFMYHYLYDYASKIEKIIQTHQNSTIIIDYAYFKKNSDEVYKSLFKYLSLDNTQITNKVHNPSFVKKLNRTQAMITKFSEVTRSRRKALMFNRKTLPSWMNSWLFGSLSKVNDQIDAKTLDDMRRYFKDTSKFYNKFAGKVTFIG